MFERTELERMLELEGIYTVFEGEYSAKYVFPGEVHDFWEMVYIIDGNVCVCADERVYHMHDNEIIFHRPMQLHKFNIESNRMAHMFIASFDISGKLVSQLENKACRLTPRENSQLTSIISFLAHHGSVQENTEQLSIRNFLPALSSPVVAHTARNLMENFLLSVCSGSSDVCSADDTTEAIVYSAAVRYMNTNVKGWVSTSELARICGVSLTQLKIIFSKYSGIGIHKYFLSIKLQAAIRLLSEGCSVSQTAAELNFSSQNYFSVVFKREMGISPTGYIKRKYYLIPTE